MNASCSQIRAQQSRFPYLVFLSRRCAAELKVIADLSRPHFQRFTPSVIFPVLIPEQTRMSKSPLIHQPALRGSIFSHRAQQTCKLPHANHQPFVKLVPAGPLTPSVPSPLHHHHRMHMLITLSYLFFSVFFPFILPLPLSLIIW